MDDGDTIIDFIRTLWRARLSLLIGGLIGALAGLALVYSLQPQYRATMIVAPSLIDQSGESLTRFENGQNVALDRLGLERAVPPEFVRFEQILRGSTVAGILSRYDGIAALMGQDRLFVFQNAAPLDQSDVPEYLIHHVSIEPIGTTTSRRISFTHPDRDFAVRLLGHLHKISDATIRQKAGSDTQQRIAWLQRELSTTSNPDHRAALTALLLAQERRRMLVSMDQPYAAEIVEAPSSFSKPAWPSYTLMMVVSIFVGMLGGFVIFSLRRPVS